VAPRPVEPALPEDVTPDLLDQEVRRDLRGLPKDLADNVARHLVAVGELIEDDPEAALAHARFARHRASRVAVVREASGLAAYHAGEWAEALSELRASRRMGGAAHVAVMADAERALGRPERALEIARSPESADLPRDEAMELLIVTSGARRDLGEHAAAVVGLQVPELDVRREDPWTPRLFYAYGEALLGADRRDDAVRAFLDAAQTDTEGETDAEERAALVAAGIDTPPGELDVDDQEHVGRPDESAELAGVPLAAGGAEPQSEADDQERSGQPDESAELPDVSVVAGDTGTAPDESEDAPR
jgi:tetratricopeptide (TPR) repeat protein